MGWWCAADAVLSTCAGQRASREQQRQAWLARVGLDPREQQNMITRVDHVHRAGHGGGVEGIAHRGDFDLRSHMEGKLTKNAAGELEVELNEHGKPKHRGSGKDLTYFDDEAKERFIPHVIEPSASAPDARARRVRYRPDTRLRSTTAFATMSMWPRPRGPSGRRDRC